MIKLSDAFKKIVKPKSKVPNPLSQQAPNPDPKVRPSPKNPNPQTPLTPAKKIDQMDSEIKDKG